ncbi:MAG TPA: glycosyltransferase family 39 protein [Tepidisphaeraceae bacterium]|nr:glycosyltransferase family 39 protein [Tepidisphaeraceae bacterium]
MPCTSAPLLDRYFWLAILLTTIIVIPRSILITQAHSPTMDEQTHLRIGLSNLLGNPSGMINTANDAPLGQMISALPMLMTGCNPAKPMNPATSPPHPLASDNPNLPMSSRPPPALAKRLRTARHEVVFGNSLPPDTLLMLIAIWKAVLFIPAAGLVFHWCRRLYGLPSGWLGLAMLLIDPTFAAYIPMATPDVLAVEGILFACYFAWRLMDRPASKIFLFTTAFFCASALLMKLTTIILPGVVAALTMIYWGREKFRISRLRHRLNILFGLAILTAVFIWAMTGFDVSIPGRWIPAPAHVAGFSFYNNILYPSFQHRWPAGHFIQILVSGFTINASDRWAYLFGHARRGGWWYYFPAIALYKIPLGFFVIFALAIWSLVRWRPRFEEWSLLLPMLAWCLMLMFLTHINTGFRHFLPAYVFILMLASRAVVRVGAMIQSIAWLSLAGSFAHVLTYHPDYLSYFNRPVATPWLICNDSNIDWGQGLKEVRQWLDDHPTHEQPVYLRYDWDPVWIDYYLHNRVQRVTEFGPEPRHGLLIICPVWVAGYWDPMDTYGYLRTQNPIAIIGHSMLVYDLDHLSKAPKMPAWKVHR